MNTAIAHLQLLSANRFALHNQPHNLDGIRQTLINAHQKPISTDTWWLIGTEGCHLCELAEYDIRQVANSYPLPHLDTLEVLDFDECIAKIFAPLLPILVTPHALLTYPFGVMDVINIIKNK